MAKKSASRGGKFEGPSHDKGGIPITVKSTGEHIEVEGGEIIINADASEANCAELSEINQSTGGDPIPCGAPGESKEKFEEGGRLPNHSILDELNKAKSDLDKGEKLQAMMKEANKIIKSKADNKEALLIEMGFNQSQAKNLMEPDYLKRVGFADYKLKNNNANNRRLKQRVEELEKKWSALSTDKQENYTFPGGRIEVNYQIDRVQILFDAERVEKDLYTQLKKNGWNYSPTNSAFQRKITPQAISNAVYLFKAVKQEPVIATAPELPISTEEIAIDVKPSPHLTNRLQVYNPNTDSEFDNVIFSKIEPKDDWIGHVIKERDVKNQIRAQLFGFDTDIDKEVERLFEKYKSNGRQVEITAPVFPESELPRALPSIGAIELVHEQKYGNQYELNKAIESLLEKGDNPADYTADEKVFIRKYSGYGGLDKYGPTGKGGFFEYYTPTAVIRKMWALAYKYGYNNGPMLEPSIGTGEFCQFAKPEIQITGYEISPYSSKIAKILYPNAHIVNAGFEENFIAKNWTIKDKVTPLYDLVIGNPPYGDFSAVQSRFMAMGELDHVSAKNYQEYFIRRGLDLLRPGGLLIYIVGASLQSGGTLFLDSGPSKVKKYIEERASLLDAYRLPEKVFERTQVTSEIIVLHKHN